MVAVIDQCSATQQALQKPDYRDTVQRVRDGIQAAINDLIPVLEKSVFADLPWVKRRVEQELRGQQPKRSDGTFPADQGHVFVAKRYFGDWCENLTNASTGQPIRIPHRLGQLARQFKVAQAGCQMIGAAE